MAILNSLSVNGSSRFLNKAWFNDVSIGGTLSTAAITAASLTSTGTLNVTGTSTLGTVTSGQITSSGRIYGTGFGTDGTMIIKPQSNNEFNFGGTNTSSTIYFGYRALDSKPIPTKFVFGGSGGSANLTAGSATLSGTLSAATGNITTINSSNIYSQNASISGRLRATEYDLQVAQNTGGALTVAPTLRIDDSMTATTLTRDSSNNITLRVTHSSITKADIGGITWATGCKVKVSLDVNGKPTGTMDGTITALNTSSHFIEVKVSGGDAANLDVANKSISHLAIMVYELANGNPVGIQINCYDVRNSSPAIRIYGGTSTTPTAMLGKLDSSANSGGAGLPQVNGSYPSGWGMYTSNGYFTGVIVSESGKIGGWTIGTNSIYSGNATPGASASTMVVSTGTASTNNIGGGGTTSKTWMLSAGTGFGVTTAGALYSNSGYIAGWKIESNDLVNGTWGSDNSVMLCTGSATAKSIGGSESTVNGWVITAGSKFGVTKTGALYANSATITGVIKADTGRIGGTSGWTIASQQISNGTIGADDSMFLSTKNLAGTVAGKALTTTAPSWRLTVGSNFGVTNTGVVYANSAQISGNLSATNGFTVAQDNKTLTSITTNGMIVYDGVGTADSNVVAKFTGNDTQIGKATSQHTIINTDGQFFYGPDKVLLGQIAAGNITKELVTYTNEKMSNFDILQFDISASNTEVTKVKYPFIVPCNKRNKIYLPYKCDYITISLYNYSGQTELTDQRINAGGSADISYQSYIYLNEDGDYISFNNLEDAGNYGGDGYSYLLTGDIGIIYDGMQNPAIMNVPFLHSEARADGDESDYVLNNIPHPSVCLNDSNGDVLAWEYGISDVTYTASRYIQFTTHGVTFKIDERLYSVETTLNKTEWVAYWISQGGDENDIPYPASFKLYYVPVSCLYFTGTIQAYEHQPSPFISFSSYSNTTNFGKYSFANGDQVYTTNDYAAVFGEYNENRKNSIFEIGTGSATARRNAFTIDKYGSVEICMNEYGSNQFLIKRRSAFEPYNTDNLVTVDPEDGTVDIFGELNVGGLTVKGIENSIALTANWDGCLRAYDLVAKSRATSYDEYSYRYHYSINDKTGQIVGAIGNHTYVNGSLGSFLTSRRLVNNKEKINTISVNIDNNGDAFYGVTDPRAFCTALNLGQILSHEPDAVSCATGKYMQIAYLTLTPGTWLINGSGYFPYVNTTGVRRIYTTLATSGYNNVTTGPESMGNQLYDQEPVTGSYVTFLHISKPITVTSNTTIRLIGWQNSGSAISVVGRLYAARLA